MAISWTVLWNITGNKCPIYIISPMGGENRLIFAILDVNIASELPTSLVISNNQSYNPRQKFRNNLSAMNMF